MEPTLKKRLIGAAILIVIAAIVLPMFLVDRPETRQDSRTLSLDIPPAPDRDMSQVTLSIGEQASPTPADPDQVAAVDTATVPPVTGPATSTPTEQLPATQAPTPAGSGATSPPAASTPALATSPANPIQQAAAPTAVPTSPEGSFWVSMGSYGQSANADRVVNAARGRGVAIQRDSVSTGGRDLIRLRAGPYATRAQAEQARQLLIAAVPDAKPKVESSGQAPTADAPAASTPAGAGAWAVQVGAFGQEVNAKQLSDRLKAAGFPAFVQRRGESYAVRVGPYVRRTDAETQRQRLKSDQRLDGLIVSHPG